MMNMLPATGDRAATRSIQSLHQSQKAPSERDQHRLHIREWLEERIRAAGDRLFRADDARASRLGWQVSVGRSGLNRTYRDPRFDLLTRCSGCAGTGQSESQPCACCAGEGRITLGDTRRDRHASRW